MYPWVLLPNSPTPTLFSLSKFITNGRELSGIAMLSKQGKGLYIVQAQTNSIKLNGETIEAIPLK